MDPIQALLSAVHGGGGQPMPMPMGGQPAQIPAPPSRQEPSNGSDTQTATQLSQILTAALQHTQDQELQAAISQALQTFHRYLVADQKEKQQALQGKLSPRLMAQAHGAAR